MTQIPYQCTCHTCQQEQVEESYSSANDFFDRHASRGHEVEITRVAQEQTAVVAE